MFLGSTGGILPKIDFLGRIWSSEYLPQGSSSLNIIISLTRKMMSKYRLPTRCTQSFMIHKACSHHCI